MLRPWRDSSAPPAADYGWSGAYCDVEREFGQATGAAPLTLVGPASPRCGVPAGDQAL